jgi:hypothetical protein
LLVTFEERVDLDFKARDSMWTEKFYRRGYGDRELAPILMQEYDYHIDLVVDLTLELTRSANYICDKVR